MRILFINYLYQRAYTPDSRAGMSSVPSISQRLVATLQNQAELETLPTFLSSPSPLNPPFPHNLLDLINTYSIYVNRMAEVTLCNFQQHISGCGRHIQYLAARITVSCKTWMKEALLWMPTSCEQTPALPTLPLPWPSSREKASKFWPLA